VATLPVTPDELSENAPTPLVLDSSVAATDDDDSTYEGGRRLWFYGTIGMEYDSYSDCIAISSALIKGVLILDRLSAAQWNLENKH
jgi:hypothetical protein